MAKFRMPFPEKVERLPGDDFQCEGPSLTVQDERDSCDINNIVAKFHKTGDVGRVNANAPMFIDLPTSVEYQDALGLQKGAFDAFMLLPAEVRARFDNSPVKFLAYTQEHEDFLVDLGLAPSREEFEAESADLVREEVEPGVLPGQLAVPGTGVQDVPPASAKPAVKRR